jgi:hypothetical protein
MSPNAGRASFRARRADVPTEIKPLPPDHPIFQLGVGFVLHSDLPPEREEQHDDDEHDVDD